MVVAEKGTQTAEEERAEVMVAAVGRWLEKGLAARRVLLRCRWPAPQGYNPTKLSKTGDVGTPAQGGERGEGERGVILTIEK